MAAHILIFGQTKHYSSTWLGYNCICLC